MGSSWRGRDVSEAVAIHGLPRTYGARNDKKCSTTGRKKLVVFCNGLSLVMTFFILCENSVSLKLFFHWSIIDLRFHASELNGRDVYRP